MQEFDRFKGGLFIFNPLCAVLYPSHLTASESLIQAYTGTLPFQSYLKGFFKEHKKYGSRDRRLIQQLCYARWRSLGIVKALPESQQWKAAVFLTSHAPNALLAAIDAELNTKTWLPLLEKAQELGLDSEDMGLGLFPHYAWLSASIDRQAFAEALLHPPHLFLRVRPGRDAKVEGTLQAQNIPFSRPLPHCLQLPNNTSIAGIVALNRDAVVQDLSSQRVLEGLMEKVDIQAAMSLWDCCAASGGKTILLHDAYPKARITVSDIRESILHNLIKRLREAGVRPADVHRADLSAGPYFTQPRFDLILCDAPCSGSGTWGRTPESIQFFTEEKLAHYVDLQKRIATNVIPALKSGGYLLYITCSVFAAENEEIVAHLIRTQSLELVDQRYLIGYNDGADTLFAALLRLKL